MRGFLKAVFLVGFMFTIPVAKVHALSVRPSAQGEICFAIPAPVGAGRDISSVSLTGTIYMMSESGDQAIEIPYSNYQMQMDYNMIYNICVTPIVAANFYFHIVGNGYFRTCYDADRPKSNVGLCRSGPFTVDYENWLWGGDLPPQN